MTTFHIALALALSAANPARASGSDELCEATRVGAAWLRQIIEDNNFQAYGFEARAEAQSPSFPVAIREAFVTLDDLRLAGDGTPIASSAYDTGVFLITIAPANAPPRVVRSLLTAATSHGSGPGGANSARAVAIGGARLAAAVQSVFTSQMFSASTAHTPSLCPNGGERPVDPPGLRLLSIPALRLDFLAWCGGTPWPCADPVFYPLAEPNDQRFPDLHSLDGTPLKWNSILEQVRPAALVHSGDPS